MIIGIPKEVPTNIGLPETRVALSPAGVAQLVEEGIKVIVENNAGEGAHYLNETYTAAGASIAYSREEVFRRADLLLKVRVPVEEEWEMIREGLVLCGFLHLVVAPKKSLETLIAKKATAIGWEIVEREDGVVPVLRMMSQVAGKMSVQIAARLLESTSPSGRGILIPGVVGIPPAEVVILGAGTLGFAAAGAFHGLGANVYVADQDVSALERVETHFNGQVATLLATPLNIDKLVRFADVFIGAILQPGARAPTLVTRDMVKTMKKGAVIIDFSIDQGGCVETTRLTPTLDHVFTSEGVIHFAAPNVTAWVGRTATRSLTLASIRYVKTLATQGLDDAARLHPAIRNGLYVYRGHVVNENLAAEGYPLSDIGALLGKGRP